MKHLEPGNLIIQKAGVWEWWVMQGEHVTGQNLRTRAGSAATVLFVGSSGGEPLACHEGYVEAMLGYQRVRTYIKLAKWRLVWEVA